MRNLKEGTLNILSLFIHLIFSSIFSVNRENQNHTGVVRDLTRTKKYLLCSIEWSREARISTYQQEFFSGTISTRLNDNNFFQF